ncbi:hypothetical protein DM860_000147 [Cuscuta australis]|uniref:Uncharacterized protein n=1 Tax=Cuscuta australis TaxID=267555 RepID=A0A328D0Q4_9ASTE|nr:hypothetical protein DM860_000147 [Cuscuta australis]
MDKRNKKNVSTIKPDAHMLSMEPLQMKKKSDGYNLRKSFAWNKSFFTDEGVLDPIELSLISGTCTDTSRGGLCSIEERRTPQSCNSWKNVSSPSKSIKKNLSKEINATSSKEDTAKSSCKALATQNDRTSSTGRVCHRSLFSTPYPLKYIPLQYQKTVPHFILCLF